MFFRTGWSCVALLWFAGTAAGAPALRLLTPEELERPIWVEVGQNGPQGLFFWAYNNGDGTLDVQAEAPNSPWVTPEVEGPTPCPSDNSKTCRRVVLRLSAADLEAGEYSGAVEVRAPGAVDAPQSVPLRLYVGGDVPERIDLYLPRIGGRRDFVDFDTAAGDAPELSAAGDLLTVSSSNNGSFRFLHTHTVAATYREGMPVGDLQGSVSVAGSSFGADNGNFPVTVHVTDAPILDVCAPSLPGFEPEERCGTPELRFRTAQGVAAAEQVLALRNWGEGDLALEGAAATQGSEGWLNAEIEEAILRVGVDPADLEPGVYRGAVDVTSNAANGPIQIPVVFELSAPGPPEAGYLGAVNGATFRAASQLAPGAIASLFGSQLAYSTALASESPLPTELAGVRVLVDGLEAPIFYASYGQINFQIPLETGEGLKLIQAVRDGQEGNEVSAMIAGRSPGIFRLGIGEYGAIQNPARGNSFPMPVEIGAGLGVATEPAHLGDVIVIYATGLGPVSPSVPTGAAAPSGQLSHAVDVPLVNFSRLPFGPLMPPSYVGLTPGFVGLYQVNVAVPLDLAPNPRTPETLEYADGRRSNTVEIAVED